MRRVVWTLSLVLAASTARADESIVNSQHDLSCWGPGPIRAVNETQACIFCHTPHNASPAAPLWNRHNPTSYYRIYRSPTTDARVTQPGPASKLCLSCHDGTIALGLTLNRPITDPIPMTHPFIPSGPSNLTTDLSDDHPIGFRYDRTLSNRDNQLRAPELVDHRIKLGERGELECTACHDPHNDSLGNFLRITDRAGTLCNTCHQLRGWDLSAHAHSPRRVPPTVSLGQQLPYSSLADNACRSCHLPHSAPYREQLLYDRPSQLCLDCHNGLDAPNVQAVMDQRSGHRLSRFREHRRPPENRRATTRTVDCTDCHNPHAAAAAPLTGALGVSAPGPFIPNSLREVPGVTLSGLQIERATYYYEVCFRCHADTAVLVTNRIIRQRDDLGNIRRQFLPTAASAHPVAFPTRLTGEVPSLLPQLRTRQFISCQDCHNNPDARGMGGTELNGPHGSRYDHLLAARYETRDYTAESPQTYALCYTCHDRNSILSNASFSLHQRHIVRGRTPCSACHAPHGVSGSAAEHGHLINFDLGIVSGQRQYIDTGRYSGTCTLTCHGVQHVNFTYQP